ncbi:MAG: hypothetical protein M3P37_13185 [Actinomycetota bacterium]|nr:hypothetical protein [Actinomycetota bacterium]
MGTASFGLAEERIAWEGLASSCVEPIRRLGAFLILGFVAFIAMTTAVVLFYNLFGTRIVEGHGVEVPPEAFYASMAFGLFLGLGGYLVWILKSLRSYESFSRVLRRGGLDPKRPTMHGLKAYSDEQLLALRSRYENLGAGRLRALLEGTFGFQADDSFSLGPLNVLPGTFEMDVLRMEWETSLILSSSGPGQDDEAHPEISWWTESRHDLLPRRANEMRKLLFALQYTRDSVRSLKRRYGYRSDHWHATVPEGELWDAVRDLEEARRIQAVLNRRPRVG